MRRAVRAAALAALAVFAVGGCGASGMTSSSQPANPVGVLKLTGCPVPSSVKYGNIASDNDRVADCYFPGGEDITVLTYPSVAYRDNRLAHPLDPPEDGFTYIKGPGASIIVVAPMGGTGASPAQIAARVHGTVVGQ